MGLDQLPGQRQPEARACPLPLRVADLPELLEDVAWSSGAMPTPVSATTIATTRRPRAIAVDGDAPPSGVNLIAFESRL